MKIANITILLLLLSLSSSCGLRVPDVAEPWDGPKGTAQLEFEIRRKVYCELKDAVKVAYYRFIVRDRDEKTNLPIKGSERSLLPKDWVAQITLQLQVEESVSLNPGLSFNTPMHAAVTNFDGQFLAPSGSLLSTMTYPFLSTPQSYNLGMGGQLQSTALKNLKYNGYWRVETLLEESKPNSLCDKKNPARNPFENNDGSSSNSSLFLLQSELGITDWLVDSLQTETWIYSDKKEGSGGMRSPKSDVFSANPDQLQEEIRFVVISNGNITPTWKLVRVSANTAGLPLFGTGRTRNHSLIITFAPSGDSTLHQATLFGQAVSSSFGPR